MPTSGAHQLHFPNPNPTSFEEVASDLQMVQRWGRELPFHGPQKLSVYAPLFTSASVPAGGNDAAIAPAVGTWQDVNTQLDVPWLVPGRNLQLPFMKYDFDTAIEFTISMSCYTDTPGPNPGVITVACQVNSLERITNFSGPLSPFEGLGVPARTLGKFFFNQTLVHHTIPTFTLIIPPCPNGWWVIEPRIYTVPQIIWDSSDTITMVAREIPRPLPAYTGLLP